MVMIIQNHFNHNNVEHNLDINIDTLRRALSAGVFLIEYFLFH